MDFDRTSLRRGLTPDQFDEFFALLEDGQPWTPQEIDDLLWDRYGVTYDRSHLARILRAEGMQYVKPRPMDPRQSPDAEGVSNTNQTDGSIYEDQFLNFLVKRVDEEVVLDFAPNAETSSKDIFEVLVGERADGTSVSTLCEKSEDSPHHNTILYHFREKFDLELVERIGKTLLQKDVLDVLPEQMEVCADPHLRPLLQ